VREEAAFVDPKTQEYLEVDILIPSLNLALEYQVSTLASLLPKFSQTRYRKNITTSHPSTPTSLYMRFKQETQ